MSKKLLTFAILLLLLPHDVWARATHPNANRFAPAIDGGPYLTLQGSQTLEPWKFQVGGIFHYAKNPLEIGSGGNKGTGVIDHLLMMDVFGAVGLADWFSIGLDVPVALYEDFHDIRVTPPTSEKTTQMGDVRLETKFRLLNIDKHSVGIALVPYGYFPTGSGFHLVGNNSFAGGGTAVFDFDIRHKAQISINAGYFARDKVIFTAPTFSSTIQDDEFTYGLGINVVCVAPWLEFIGEAHGSTSIHRFFSNQEESPLEVNGAFRFNLDHPKNLSLLLGGGGGITFGYGTPNIRAFFGISYPNPKRERPEKTPPPVPQPETLARIEKNEIKISRKIHFEYNRSSIQPVSFPILDAVVAILKETPSIHQVRVEGHTDGTGTPAYNMKLSERRANAVRDYLLAHGIHHDRVIAVGYGLTQPLDSNENEVGRARNRRVQFMILDR